jgi:hypothetical protein
LTTAVNTIKPVQRDAIGVAFVLLSGLGVIFLPTTAKFACLDGSNVLKLLEPAAGALGFAKLSSCYP